MLPCQLPSVQHWLHDALDMPMRHCPAAAALLFVKYEIDQLHDTVAPSDTTPEVPSEA